MVPHSCISECLEMFGIVENRKFMSDSMQPWKLELASSGKSMGDGYIQGRIFQEDSLFPLPFVLCMILMTLILRKIGPCDE